jgi:hypothetical protein
MVQLIKFTHMICGPSMFGLLIAQHHYLRRAYKSKKIDLLIYSISFAKYLLIVCLLLALMQVITGYFLVEHVKTVSWHVRWVQVAMAMGITLFSLVLAQLISLQYLSHDRQNIFKKNFYFVWVINWLLFFCIVLTIRDAVMMSTWL